MTLEEKSLAYLYDIDLHEFEQQIRADERSKIYRKISQRIRELSILLIQKLLGIAIIIGVIIMFSAGLFYEPEIQNNDVTVLLIIIPLALVLIFSNERIIN